MATDSKSIKRYRLDSERIFSRHPVLTLAAWAAELGGSGLTTVARERARYYCKTGRLARLARGIYAPISPGSASANYVPDPYLVAAALRPDAVLSHHTALDLLGLAHSVFSRFTYCTVDPRRTLRLSKMSWHALRHPAALVRAKETDFGTVTIDRQGVMVTITGPERTLVDGFADPRWVGGLEEHIQSAAAMRDLDLDMLRGYLRLLNRRILYAAVGWFLQKYTDVAVADGRFLQSLERHVPRQPQYLERSRAGGRLEARWNLIVPAHLSLNAGFEGVAK